MKNIFRLLVIIAVITVIGFTMAACPADGGGTGGGGTTLIYKGVNNSGDEYELKITGDNYELNSGSNKSTGTVTGKIGTTYTLKPSVTATTFTATVTPEGLRELAGSITWDSGTMEALPGQLTATGGSGGGKESWNDVTSLSQLDGTWKGTETHTFIYNNDYNGAKNINVKEVFEEALTINASTKTMSDSGGKVTVTFSGGNLNDVWDDIKDNWGRIYSSRFFDDSTHTFTAISSPSTSSIDMSMIRSGGVQINQNGTKIKYSYSMSGGGYYSNESVSGSFTKQSSNNGNGDGGEKDFQISDGVS